MKKKIVAFMMAFALAACSVASPAGSVTVWAEERQVTTYFEYKITGDGSIRITGCIGGSRELVIPSEIDGKRVTSIGAHAFGDCFGLRSVTIPGSVTSIGEEAFSYCDLTSVIIPEGVTSIGSGAFRNCNLRSVTIPRSVTGIGERAFSNCGELDEIDVAEGNVNYASEQGMLCNKEKTELIFCPEGKEDSVTIPESVTSIGEEAFKYCSELAGIDVAEGNPNYASEQGVLYNKEKTELIRYP